MKKQATISRSSIEIEYWAMANATSETIWIRNLLTFLCVPVPSAKMYHDNQAAMHIANNPIFHKCTKHIKVDCHFGIEHIVSIEVTP